MIALWWMAMLHGCCCCCCLTAPRAPEAKTEAVGRLAPGDSGDAAGTGPGVAADDPQ